MDSDHLEQNKKEIEPLSFSLDYLSKPSLETLVALTPGTVIYVSSDNKLDSLGYKFYPIDLLRQEDYYILNRRSKSKDDLLLKIRSYDNDIRFNFTAFENKHSLYFTPKRTNNGSSIGLFVGDLIVGTKGAVDVVVLMKVLMQEDIGWIFFARYRSDIVGLELQ